MTDGCKFCTLCFGVYVSDIFFLINSLFFTPSLPVIYRRRSKKDSPPGGSFGHLEVFIKPLQVSWEWILYSLNSFRHWRVILSSMIWKQRN